MKIGPDDLKEPAERVQTRLAARTRREEKRRRSTRITLLVAGLLLCAGVAAVVLWAVLGSGEGLPRVPEVVGMSFKDAKRAIEAAGLTVEVDPRQDVSAIGDQASRTVEDQDPGEGKTVEKATLVTVSLKGVPERADETEPAAGQASAESQEPASPAPAAQPVPEPSPPAPAQPQPPALVAPIEGKPLYPLTADASIACGHWSAGSQDYPYFGAPRDGGSRMHAGIDVYPAAGAGATVRAIKDGTVVKVAVFYTRYTGETTYGVLVDHGDFVANYAELQPVGLGPGDGVARGQEIGKVSGTEQLHFEQYAPGTTTWTSWRGDKPSNLLDPTGLLTGLGL